MERGSVGLNSILDAMQTAQVLMQPCNTCELKPATCEKQVIPIGGLLVQCLINGERIQKAVPIVGKKS